MARSGYFHGDLRRALLDAGLDAARAAGPEAVSVRELARMVGVAPSAVYRHFESHERLVSELALRAQAMVADAMEAEVALVTDVVGRAWADGVLAAVGTGYIRFAWREPGLFRIAFRTHGDLDAAHDERGRGSCGRTPYEQLERALDALVEVGELAEQERAGAEALAWSSVHGFALLTVEGPLRSLDEQTREQLVLRIVEMVRQGLAQRAGPGA
ncbi:TetR/AcrR family transcriptional regulator [Agrococcus sp. ARC_14]|uniref:TetR/AcrR family transcriptional regulator n=1 Tax=Agrococcus sp. ARC_14 TaxID=2919927 RepID=UPI001F066F8C|nr:TetR/AcrR family transcriptional regulator [Agrococcus sp. ARC_14]MCH1882571.1 TetR/AcrR family transcriptional regulator [Agrococcus sp. ARC_14]